MSDELTFTLASIQEFMVGTTQVFQLGLHMAFHSIYQIIEITPPPVATVLPPMIPTTDDTRLIEQEARVERLEARMRQIILQDEDFAPERMWLMSWRPPDRGQMSLFSSFDLKSLVHATFSVEETIARGLWTDIAHSLDSKGKKLVGLSSSLERLTLLAISIKGLHFTHLTGLLQSELIYLIHRYQYQPVYVQQPYIAQN
ncbi:hypothetical protein CK203_105856 [Vitis vinifera]|uniref:Uncharacterized protein n=1 Tax=Vitis vinifera TaxID=29760 RepID=A0A438EQ50_VITVI|nr:hypothetical protein CK203_105856 [Vitis vinifera]